MARKFGWVRKLPSGRFQASYISPDGTRVNAPTTFTKEEHADKWLAAQRTDIERETWKGPTVGVTTLRAYAVPWLAQRTALKPRTADLYQRLLTLHILPTLGDTQLKALTPARVREWHRRAVDHHRAHGAGAGLPTAAHHLQPSRPGRRDPGQPVPDPGRGQPPHLRATHPHPRAGARPG